MFIFKITKDGLAYVSEINNDALGDKRTTLDSEKYSFLIRGDIRIMGDTVTSDSVEIASDYSYGKPLNYLNLSDQGDSWIDKRGDSADIQRFEEIITSGKVLVVIK